ncbi:MAG: hypothetical protein RJA83_647 [Pseudomonadota bacterium]|jgi:hypothetical protein
MSKYDLSNFKIKIAPRDKEQVEIEASSRFTKADETLGVVEEIPKANSVKKKSYQKVIRKTFSITKTEIELILKIKDKALNKKVILSDSAIARIGFLLLSDLSDGDLVSLSKRLEKTPLGRPVK